MNAAREVLPYDAQDAAYRVVQDALTDVHSHGGEALEVTVLDD